MCVELRKLLQATEQFVYHKFLECDYTVAGVAIGNGAIRGRNKEKRNEHER